MNWDEYVRHSVAATDWIANYHRSIDKQPVRSQATPGDTSKLLPASAPEEGEDFAQILADFEKLVPPGLTNWLHPRFFAYFPANADASSMIAEQLAAGMNAQCMLWQTSPVGTEMELRMVDWLRDLCALPSSWTGSLHDTASSSTLVAVLVARERALDWKGIEHGLAGGPRLRFYGTAHAHASVPKALWIAGIGKDNFVQVGCDAEGSADLQAMCAAIAADRDAGMLPAGIIAVVGSTSTGVSDKLRPLGELAREQGLHYHVDAAWAGAAMICPELRGLIDGAELADSYVFNPHKWLSTNIDCSVLLYSDADAVKRTLSAQPDYLRTRHAQGVTDFSTISLHLGRRFRALKLWFVLRSLGAKGLRCIIRNHIAWAHEAAGMLAADSRFCIVTGPELSLFTFRLTDGGRRSQEDDARTQRLLEIINNDGFTYMTGTETGGRSVIRMQVGSNSATREHVLASVARVTELADRV